MALQTAAKCNVCRCSSTPIDCLRKVLASQVSSGMSALFLRLNSGRFLVLVVYIGSTLARFRRSEGKTLGLTRTVVLGLQNVSTRL